VLPELPLELMCHIPIQGQVLGFARRHKVDPEPTWTIVVDSGDHREGNKTMSWTQGFLSAGLATRQTCKEMLLSNGTSILK